jgi:hypothetical protein
VFDRMQAAMNSFMAEQRKLSIYLAGPVTNCNDKQKTEWRTAIEARLAKLGHKCIDPTDHVTWAPFKEIWSLQTFGASRSEQ